MRAKFSRVVILMIALNFFALVRNALAFPHKGPRRLLVPSAPNEIQVNTYKTGAQERPTVAVLTDGKVIIAWQSANQDNGGFPSVYAQMYNVNGSVKGTEFRVNNETANTQGMPAVGALTDGGFVIAWNSNSVNQEGGTYGVYAQRYDSDGMAIGINFRANNWTAGNQQIPAVAGLSDGGFLIVWQSQQTSGKSNDIYGQRYYSNGTTRGLEFLVNTFTSNSQEEAAVTGLANGGFIVTWMSYNQQGGNYVNDIYFQRFDTNGNRVGVETRANTNWTYAQEYPSIAELTDGKFVIVWQSALQDPTSTIGSGTPGIYGQMYNADGSAFGVEFRVNTYTDNAQEAPSVASLPDGSFIVVWQSSMQDGKGYGVFGQVFNINGNFSGSEFQANAYATNDQKYPVVAVLPNGYIIAWQDSFFDLSSQTVMARWFTCPATTPILYNNSCIATCPTEAPIKYKNACYTACPSTAAFTYNQECLTQCPVQFPYAYNKTCIANCPPEASYIYNNICYTTCPSQAPTPINGQCYAGCPAETPYFYNQDCYASCPVEAPYSNNMTCSSACPSQAPILYNNSCYVTCPPEVPLTDGLGCFTACPTGKPLLFNQTCYTTCPIEAPNLSDQQCYAICPNEAPYSFNKTCYVTCPAEAINKYNGSCYADCPTAAPYLYNQVCYSKCPNEASYSYNQVCDEACPALAPFSFNKTCNATCPAEAPVATNNTCSTSCTSQAPYLYNQQCYATCPTEASYLYNNNCYATCPNNVPNHYNQQCYAACPTAASYSYNHTCLTVCPSEATYSYNKICFTSCPTEAPYSNNQTCYVTCPSQAPIINNGQCLTTCPSEVPYLYNFGCYSTCPTAAPNLYNGACYLTCPAIASYLYNNLCYSSCPVEAPLSNNKQCYTACPTEAPNLYNQLCYATCPSQARYSYNKNCYTSCPANAPISNANNECISSCPAETPYSYNQTCYASCPTEAPNLYNQICYTSCPAEASYSFNNLCYSSCPAQTPYSFNKVCYATCPAQAPKVFNNQCYTSCPANAPNMYNQQCYSNCPTLAPYLYNLVCYTTCPTEAPNTYNQACYATCPAQAPILNGTECSANCPAQTPYSYNLGCYATCPNEAPNSYNHVCYNTCPNTAPYLSGQTCYTACPAEAPNSYNKICYTTCPTGASNLYNNQCYVTCPSAAPNQYQHQCYINCPNGAPFLSDKTCYTACPASTPNSFNSNCYTACPNEAPYLYNQTCYATCPSQVPNVFNKECLTECPTTAPKSCDNVCLTECPSEDPIINVIANQNEATTVMIQLLSLVNSNNPNLIFITGFGSMIYFVKYIDITLPTKVQTMLGAQGSGLVSAGFGTEAPETLKDNLSRRVLAEVFQENDSTESGLYNLWDPLVSLLIILIITFGIIIAEYSTRKYKNANNVFKVLLKIAKWNLPLLILCGNFSNIMFYSFIDFKSVSFESTRSIVSFVICLVLFALSLLVVVHTILIIINIRKSQVNLAKRKNWNDYYVLYFEFKDKSYWTLAFLPIFFIRLFLVNIVIITAVDSPLFETIFFTILSALMLVYIVWKRPLKSKLLLCHVLLNEALVFALNVCLLILAFLDKEGITYMNDRKDVGDVIVALNAIFSTCNLVFIVVVIIRWILILYIKIKAARAQGITSFVETIKFIFSSESDPEAKKKDRSELYTTSAALNINNTTMPKVDTVESSRINFLNVQTHQSSPGLPRNESSLFEDMSITKPTDEARAYLRRLRGGSSIGSLMSIKPVLSEPVNIVPKPVHIQNGEKIIRLRTKIEEITKEESRFVEHDGTIEDLVGGMWTIGGENKETYAKAKSNTSSPRRIYAGPKDSADVSVSVNDVKIFPIEDISVIHAGNENSTQISSWREPKEEKLPQFSLSPKKDKMSKYQNSPK